MKSISKERQEKESETAHAASGSKKSAPPLKYLRDARGRSVLVKLKDGGEFVGVLDFSDNTMNVILKDCLELRESNNEPKARHGTILIRGSNILFISLNYTA
ncbi:MAG: U6 snRNA-associated Sm-like protein LSm6 [Fervidicoccaceae archaeon]